MEHANTPALLLLDLPASALGGIDLLAFTVTPRFRGVKGLPHGFHFAFCGTSTAFSERHGLWFRIGSSKEPAPLFIAQWNVNAEILEAVIDETERMRWRANLGSVWREGLTPYRQTTSTSRSTVAGDDGNDADEEEVHDWPTLTSGISSSLLTRITGGDADHWSLTSASSARRDLEDIPGLSSSEKEELQSDKELHFLPIDLKQTWPTDATGRQRTLYAQDRSWALSNLIRHHCTDSSSDEILGELQFCFLMILTINNFSCLEQWRRILTLVFTCKSAVSASSGFFVNAIAALRLQLQHCKDAEGGLIDLTDESGSLLKSLLTRFRKGLEGMVGTGVQDVIDELDDLEEYLRDEHHWELGGDFARAGVLELEDGEQVQMESSAFDEDDETGEFAPQIVELTAEQARLLNVTPEDARALGASLSKASLNDKVADVVQDSEEEEEESDVRQMREEESDEEEEEETQDLDEMDSRY